jgi:bla regulator protein blaR1
VELNVARSTALALTLMLGLANVPLKGQATANEVTSTQAGGKMAFEVASIHPAKPGKFTPPSFALDPGDAPIPAGGHFFADFPLIVYLTFAYKLWPTQDQNKALLAQMPKWAGEQSFVIEAKAEGNPTKDQMRLMVQSLLAERFKLAVHFERRRTPVFALALAKPGRLGPKLRPHAEGPPCDAQVPPLVPGQATTVPAVFPARCGAYAAWPLPNNSKVIGVRDSTMPLIGHFLAWDGHLGRPAVDETGLKGTFDFTLEYSPESDAAPGPGAEAQHEALGPTFLEAIEDQLGLKLKPTTAPLDVLVIDHVEQPSPN